HLPAAPGAQAAAEPIFETMEGWSGTTGGARSWADLPAQAIKYVRRIEELVEAPVTLLSTSPERDDTILMRDPFEGSSGSAQPTPSALRSRRRAPPATVPRRRAWGEPRCSFRSTNRPR